MIHYHGTPAGGKTKDAVRFLARRHALIPFARPDHLRVAMRVCRSFVLDNSAFTHWRKGHGVIDVPAYHGWVNSVAHHPRLHWCLIPDKIDGTEDENIELVTSWLRNGCEVPSVPVWHLHESLDWLDWLVSNFDRVALGSSGQWARPGTSAWWDRMASAMAVACDQHGKPRAKLHGLRMLDPEIFTRLPLESADSCNAAINSGSARAYVAPERWQRATNIAWRIEKHRSAALWVSQGEQLRLMT